MNKNSFSERLNTLVRGRGNCSVREFSQQADLSPPAMAKYINGESTPNLPRLLSIAKALNVRLGWLASGTGIREADDDYFKNVRLDLFPDRLDEVTGGNPRYLSSTSNLSITGVTKYLNGESTPNVERLISIAEAGGVSVEWLATGIKEVRNEGLENESSIGNRIEELAQGFVGGKKRLAAISGVSESQLHRYIAGTSQPTITPLIEIAKALGVRFEWLATGNGSQYETSNQTEPPPKRLKAFDTIELTGEHKVYADVPCHFVKAGRRGDFSLTNHLVTLIDNFDYLQGAYVVTKVDMASDYKVTCVSVDGKHTVSFHQSGDSPSVIKHIIPIE